MKMILVPAVPFIQSSIGLFPPIGSIAIGSTLRKNGFDVFIVDVSTMNNWQEILKKEVMEPDVIAVGIASYTSSSISLALEAIEVIKKNNPALPIMWGGYHASASWKEILEEGLVNLVVRSAGEVATLKVLQEIAKNKRIEDCDFSSIDNVAYMVQGEAHSNPVSIQLPEETVPVLDYSLIDIKKYDSMATGRVFAYSSHGCPSKCTFCSESSHTCGKWTGFSAERTVSDIRHYVEKYGATKIDFLEANFAANTKRVLEICKGIISNNLKVSISANMRVRDINRIYKNGGIGLLKEAGFDEIFIGAESGSNRILDYLHKGSSRDEIRSACSAVGAAGIGAKVSWMHDLPGETLEDSEATISLSRELCVYDNMRQVHHIFFPFPNTPIFNDVMSGFKVSKQSDWVSIAGKTTFGGSSIYEGNKDIRTYAKNAVEELKKEFPKVFIDQSPLNV